MTPQEYSLLTRLVQGCATWKNYVTTLINNPQIVNFSNFAGFFDQTTQTNPVPNNPNVVNISQTEVSNGISMANGSQIVFSNPGVYLVNFLGSFTGGGSSAVVYVWLAVNGVTVPNSAYAFNTNNNTVLANVENVRMFNAGDYIQWYWASSGSGMQISSSAASGSRPATRGVNVTITQLN
jgi:hypothetical protein